MAIYLYGSFIETALEVYPLQNYLFATMKTRFQKNSRVEPPIVADQADLTLLLTSKIELNSPSAPALVSTPKKTSTSPLVR